MGSIIQLTIERKSPAYLFGPGVGIVAVRDSVITGFAVIIAYSSAAIFALQYISVA